MLAGGIRYVVYATLIRVVSWSESGFFKLLVG